MRQYANLIFYIQWSIIEHKKSNDTIHNFYIYIQKIFKVYDKCSILNFDLYT